MIKNHNVENLFSLIVFLMKPHSTNSKYYRWKKGRWKIIPTAFKDQVS
jgi:hypothetical protein